MTPRPDRNGALRQHTGLLVTPGRLELPAYGLGNRRSILLSYGVTCISIVMNAVSTCALCTFDYLTRFVPLGKSLFLDGPDKPGAGVYSIGAVALRQLRKQPIPNSWLGNQKPGGGIIGPNLLAELAHQNPQILDILKMRGAPHFLQQLLMCNDFAGVPHQKAQKVILFWRKVDLIFAKRHPSVDTA